MKMRCIAVIGLSVFASVTIAGCSTKAWYGGMKFAAENECRRQPPGEIEACLARLNTMSYEEYERKRSGHSNSVLTIALWPIQL